MEERQRTLDDFPANVKECIGNIVTMEGYVKHNVTVRSISTGGNNFMGELFGIEVKGATIDGEKEINIFIKQIINNDDFKVYSIPEVYRKEAFIYNELADIIKDIQKDIPIDKQFKFAKSYKETDGTAIILENLVKRQFKQRDRFDLMSLDFAEKSLNELAKFHALSFVLERLMPEYFENKIKGIKQSFVYDEYWNEFVVKMCEVSIRELREEDKMRVRDFLPVSLKRYPQYMTGGGGTIKCLCHGDYKMNNIMIKDKNERISEVLPIDYQQIYYGNPIIDLIYFIYASSDRGFRGRHLNYLKDFYFNAMKEFLGFFSINVENVYPKEEFDRCFRECLDYALMFCLYFYPLFYVSEAETHDGNDDLMEISIKVDGRLKERIQGVVDDFIDVGVI